MKPNYAKVYLLLRSCVEDALDCLPEKEETLGSRLILRMALQKTQELCMEMHERSQAKQSCRREHCKSSHLQKDSGAAGENHSCCQNGATRPSKS